MQAMRNCVGCPASALAAAGAPACCPDVRPPSAKPQTEAAANCRTLRRAGEEFDMVRRGWVTGGRPRPHCGIATASFQRLFAIAPQAATTLLFQAQGKI